MCVLQICVYPYTLLISHTHPHALCAQSEKVQNGANALNGGDTAEEENAAQVCGAAGDACS